MYYFCGKNQQNSHVIEAFILSYLQNVCERKTFYINLKDAQHT